MTWTPKRRSRTSCAGAVSFLSPSFQPSAISFQLRCGQLPLTVSNSDAAIPSAGGCTDASYLQLSAVSFQLSAAMWSAYADGLLFQMPPLLHSAAYDVATSLSAAISRLRFRLFSTSCPGSFSPKKCWQALPPSSKSRDCGGDGCLS